MFGSRDVSNLIEQERGRRATFGVYTSKTDYPGAKVKDRDKKLLNKIKSLYSGDALKKREELWEEGLCGTCKSTWLTPLWRAPIKKT